MEEIKQIILKKGGKYMNNEIYLHYNSYKTLPHLNFDTTCYIRSQISYPSFRTKYPCFIEIQVNKTKIYLHSNGISHKSISDYIIKLTLIIEQLNNFQTYIKNNIDNEVINLNYREECSLYNKHIVKKYNLNMLPFTSSIVCYIGVDKGQNQQYKQCFIEFADCMAKIKISAISIDKQSLLNFIQKIILLTDEFEKFKIYLIENITKIGGTIIDL
ncbi:MAG: hypothetical protein RBS13_05110 [Bacteroidales bacterium]|jgi:hypothetical protein|nr:hypothetical protein [Bacteroidales bacterium]